VPGARTWTKLLGGCVHSRTVCAPDGGPPLTLT
jgi:hypothetical protein